MAQQSKFKDLFTDANLKAAEIPVKEQTHKAIPAPLFIDILAEPPNTNLQL